MKKILVTVLAVVLASVFVLAGCTATPAASSSAAASSAAPASSETASSEAPSEAAAESSDKIDLSDPAKINIPTYTGLSYKIGYSTITTDGDFMAAVNQLVGAWITATGCTFETASANGNAATQITQIENFITLGMDCILVCPVDPASLTDVLTKAQEAGIKIVEFNGDSGVYDVLLGTDETANGEAAAQMAVEWIDKTFPDAAPGSIEVAVIDNRDKDAYIQRSEALMHITNMTDKVKIVKEVQAEIGKPQSAQAAAENLLLTNPDIKVILCYNGDMEIGVNDYAMSQSSAIKDKSKFGTFGVDDSTALEELVLKSAANESVVRGTVAMFKPNSTQMFDMMAWPCIAVCDGTADQYLWSTPLYKVTPEYLQQNAAPAASK